MAVCYLVQKVVSKSAFDVNTFLNDCRTKVFVSLHSNQLVVVTKQLEKMALMVLKVGWDGTLVKQRIHRIEKFCDS